MEYVDGATLEEEMKHTGGRLAEPRVIDIALQILDTLAYLHGLEPPVIYRDLKPSNVMMMANGQAKLIDFGIARHFQPQQNATMIGTQGYAPPEQYRGKVELRSDLYALGATMHHALSGRDPANEAPFSFPPLATLCPDLKPALAALVDDALAYDVEHRVPSADGIQAPAGKRFATASRRRAQRRRRRAATQTAEPIRWRRENRNQRRLRKRPPAPPARSFACRLEAPARRGPRRRRRQRCSVRNRRSIARNAGVRFLPTRASVPFAARR